MRGPHPYVLTPSSLWAPWSAQREASWVTFLGLWPWSSVCSMISWRKSIHFWKQKEMSVMDILLGARLEMNAECHLPSLRILWPPEIHKCGLIHQWIKAPTSKPWGVGHFPARNAAFGLCSSNLCLWLMSRPLARELLTPYGTCSRKFPNSISLFSFHSA